MKKFLLFLVMLIVALSGFAAFAQDAVSSGAVAPGGILEILSKVLGNLPAYLNLALGLLTAVIAIALVIPGEQPEKFLQSVVDFLAKFSKKPKE